MKQLLRIRLSYYFVALLIIFCVWSFNLPKLKFDSAALTLFSVNSFLYGFYLAPILSSQKSRIEELTRQVRAEATALFKALLLTKKLAEKERNNIQTMFGDYIEACVRDRSVAQGEKEYETLIGFCLNYKGKDAEVVDKILDVLVSNQQNRTNVSMQIGNKVYSNEWLVMFVLFSITTGFVLFLDTGGRPLFKFIAALLCTGLTMLLIILEKLNLLIHKKARTVWDPYKKLLHSRFYRID
jgi:hypothetical protein